MTWWVLMVLNISAGGHHEWTFAQFKTHASCDNAAALVNADSGGAHAYCFPSEVEQALGEHKP